MKRLLVTTACLGALLGAGSAHADYYGEGYASAWIAEGLARDRAGSYWTDMVSRRSWGAEPAPKGPRSWDPRDQNPWANTYGTPSEGPRRGFGAAPSGRNAVRMCSCYLPADARSWDGGPLTDADIARLCRAQCY
jgi:hypothetical protein